MTPPRVPAEEHVVTGPPIPVPVEISPESTGTGHRIHATGPDRTAGSAE